MYRTRVYYQDTDAGGVVYYANYLKLFEKSWFEYLLSCGISLPEWEEQGTYVLVKRVELDLLDKSRYGDELETRTSVADVKNAQFTLVHVVSRNGKPVTRGQTFMVCVDGTGKPKRMPEDFKTRLLACQSFSATTI